MLQLLAPPRVYEFMSTHDYQDIPEAPRPVTAGQIKSHLSVSTVPTSSKTSRLNRRSSIQSFGFSKINYDVPHLTKTPWEAERAKRTSLWRRSKHPAAQEVNPFPAAVFKNLPREVYDCIVEQLEILHLGSGEGCGSCLLKDLYSLCLTSRAWDRAATLVMYRKARLLTHEDPSNPRMPKLKVIGTSRLKLLRRTLRERYGLARLVQELHLSDIQALYQTATIEREEIINLVASLVMACPNLERMVGFHIPYTHSFDRLSHALSTRRNLKERVWQLSESTGFEPDEEEEEEDLTKGYYNSAIDPNERFLELNSNHPDLTTLVLHQKQSRPSIPLTFRAIVGAFRRYPHLQHLSISGLPASSFTNLALNSLPPYLKSLRLENLPGVNDKGLQKFANGYIPIGLHNLTLVNLEIANIEIISTILSDHLPELKHFTLSQHRGPLLPNSSGNVPSLWSKSLESLHWEIRSQASPPPNLHSPFPARDQPAQSFPFINSEPIACLSTSLLATSISYGRFPSLTRIRVPHDPQGLLQGVCRPLATALLPSDSSLLTSPPRRSYSPPSSPKVVQYTGILPDDPFVTHESVAGMGLNNKGKSKLEYLDDRADSAMGSPMSACFPVSIHSTSTSTSTTSSLSTPLLAPAHSRLQAQMRIIIARRSPKFRIRVCDTESQIRIEKSLGGYMGNVGSNIIYELRPDRRRVGVNEKDGEDGNQWLTGVGDVVGEWEIVPNTRAIDGCGHFGRVGIPCVRVMEMF